MLPPVIISLPFKLIFFVLVDGWHLVAGSLVKSFGVWASVWRSQIKRSRESFEGANARRVPL